MSDLPVATDDFKLITGIGPAIERRLHDAGITTYSQLAGLSAEAIAAHLYGLAGLSAERIREQGWSGQAGELAQLAPVVENAPQETAANGQHYATFTVEMLLEETNEVRRTRVVHVQDRDTETWVGWDAARLVQFIEQQASLASQPEPAVFAAEEPVEPAGQPALAGIVEIREFQVISGDAPARNRLIPRQQPFDVRLVVDMKGVQPPEGAGLHYRAQLYARRLAGGQRQLLGERDGEAGAATPLLIQLPARAAQLDAGAYRLEAEVALNSPAGVLRASAPRTLVQIY